MAKIIDGKKIAEPILAEIKNKVEKNQIKPGLATIIVGNDPLSHKFVDLKAKAAQSVGFYFEKKAYPENFDPALIVEFIREKNTDPNVHGILIQLPLPSHIQRHLLLKTIHPFKDVDCLHPKNMGLLLEGSPNFIPPVTLAVLEAIRSTKVFPEKEFSYREGKVTMTIPDLKGVEITIIGAGILVGKPLGAFFMNQHATVTICTSGTKNLKKHSLNSQIIITGTNQKDLLQPDDITDGSILIDVGQDVDPDKFEDKEDKNIHLSKSPGGIGPLTIAYLLKNTLLATKTS